MDMQSVVSGILFMSSKLRIVIIKPSKYAVDGYVERFRWGFMPNSTIPHIRSLTPESIDGTVLDIHTIDEYVHMDLEYINLLKRSDGTNTLVALVGVQSHQFHRALDLAAFARQFGCHVVIGGPHPMTCDTSACRIDGVSFALAEGELIWESILRDAIAGCLMPTYGRDGRWQHELSSPVITPPARKDLKRYVVPMLGLYPARGCPFSCTFCSVIKIAGRRIRSQSIGTTIDSLKAASAAGVRVVMFTSDNFNKYPDAEELLTAIIAERLGMRFMVQCDTQVGRQEGLIELMARAGCDHMFLGVESFNLATLRSVHKNQNRPEVYKGIVDLCRTYGIDAHFSNIIGFPEDTSSGIREHLKTLISFGPTWASFYILCPIPGTEQYHEFQQQGLIRESNLDRFDATTLTWEHPNLSRKQLEDMLFQCYARFYSARHAVDTVRLTRSERHSTIDSAVGVAAGTLFHRLCAWQRTHPMSGGIKRTRIDSANDYASLRRASYGFDHAPLPANLTLPEIDQEFSRHGNLANSLPSLIELSEVKPLSRR